jgi:hypothetical protein
VKQSGDSLILISGQPGEDARLRFITYNKQLRKWGAPDVKWVELSDQQLGLMQVQSLNEAQGHESRLALSRLAQTQRIQEAYLKARQARFDRSDALQSAKDAGTTRTCESCGKPFTPDQPYHRLCYLCYKAQYNSNSVISPYTEVESSPSTITSSEKGITIPFRSSNVNHIRLGIGFLAIIILLGSVIAIRVAQNQNSTADPLLPTSQAVEVQEEPAATSTIKPQNTSIMPPSTDQEVEEGSGELLPGVALCDCTGDIYNCRDFESPVVAQACFDYCLPNAGDVHELDRDGDKLVCEPTRTPEP